MGRFASSLLFNAESLDFVMQDWYCKRMEGGGTGQAFLRNPNCKNKFSDHLDLWKPKIHHYFLQKGFPPPLSSLVVLLV